MWPGKEFTYQCRRPKRRRFNPWVGKIPWRRKWGTSKFSRQEYSLQYSCLENPMEKEPGGVQSRGSQRVGHN